MLGYLGEPFLRVDPRGVAVNAASPTAASAGVLKKGAEVAAARPVWLLRPGRRSVVWHDARVRAPRRAAPTAPGPCLSSSTGGGAGSPGRSSGCGDLRCGRGSPCSASSCSPRFRSRSGRPRTLRTATIALGAAAGAAAVVTAIGFAADTYASPGTWIAGADEIAFAVVGFVLLVRGRAAARVGAGIGLGLLAIAVGLTKGDALLHALVLSAIPGGLARLLVVTAIVAAGAAAAVGGLYFASGGAATREPHGLLFRPQPVSRRKTD